MMPLGDKIHLIRRNNFSYLENHRRVLVFFIFQHSIKGLSHSNINLPAFSQLELIINALPFPRFKLRIRIKIFWFDVTYRIKAKGFE